MNPPVRSHDGSPASRLPPNDYGTTLGSMALVFGLLVAVAIGGPILSAAVGVLTVAVPAFPMLAALVTATALVATALRSRRSVVRRVVRYTARSDAASVTEESARSPR